MEGSASRLLQLVQDLSREIVAMWRSPSIDNNNLSHEVTNNSEIFPRFLPLELIALAADMRVNFESV